MLTGMHFLHIKKMIPHVLHTNVFAIYQKLKPHFVFISEEPQRVKYDSFAGKIPCI